MRRAVLVTGAGGKTGAAVLAALRARGARTVGLVRSDHHPAPAADEVVVGDQRDPAVLDRAMADVEAVYAVAPNLSPDELGMASAVVAACERAGVRRLVLHSVVHPQLRTMPHHADKARAEEVVVTSGLAWTVLQPNAYLQNLAAYVPGMREGVLRVPYAVDRVLASVDLADVAAVAARVLLEDVGVHGTFELSGPAEDTPIDVAATASDLLGHPVHAERVAPEGFVATLAAGPAMDEDRSRRLLAMLQHYDRHGSPGDATVLRGLLGREPRGLQEVLAELLDRGPDATDRMAAPDR
jgi:NAD(P)H dehydrogenase (quinone)